MSTVREELESSWAPKDMVLAVMPDPAKSSDVCRALLETGFEKEHVAIFRGGEAVEALDIEGKHTDNPLLRPFRAIWGYISIEGPELRVYEEASEAGQDVVAVKTVDARDVASASDVLTRFDATEVRHFADWNVADVPTEESNQ